MQSVVETDGYDWPHVQGAHCYDDHNHREPILQCLLAGFAALRNSGANSPLRIYHATIQDRHFAVIPYLWPPERN